MEGWCKGRKPGHLLKAEQNVCEYSPAKRSLCRVQELSQKQTISEGDTVPGTTASTEVLAISMRAAMATKKSGRKFLVESIFLVGLLSERDKDQKRGRDVEIFICFLSLNNNK